MMRKKIAVAAIAGIMAVSTMAMPVLNVSAAQETVTESEAESAAVSFQKLPVTVLSDMDDYDLKAGLTWEIKWNAKESDANSCVRYGQFTIPKDSYVRIKTSTEGKRPDIGWSEDYYIYGNASMGTAVISHSAAGSDDFYEMKAGTYYIKMEGTFTYWTESASNTEKMIIGCIAKENAVKLTQTPNKTKTAAVIKVDEKMMANGKGSIKIAEGNNENDINWGSYSNDYTDISSTGKYTVKENGWYVVQVTAESHATWGKDVYAYRRIKVNCIDTTKPVISGVKNNVLYNKSVKIAFSDNKGGSGIKAATLNGKSIKSGTVVTKDGKYTLKVTDKVGNVSSVVFGIDKTKPVVSGVKNNGIYNKNVKLSFSDNKGGFGLRTATLNGKSIKNGAVVTKEGKYTLKVADKAGNVTSAVFIIDKTKPIVSGVKNNQTYKKSVKITLNDNKGGSGLYKATLNGKSIKSVVTVTKPGKYTLKVKDKAGNLTTVVFAIKK